MDRHSEIFQIYHDWSCVLGDSSVGACQVLEESSPVLAKKTKSWQQIWPHDFLVERNWFMENVRLAEGYLGSKWTHPFKKKLPWLKSPKFTNSTPLGKVLWLPRPLLSSLSHLRNVSMKHSALDKVYVLTNRTSWGCPTFLEEIQEPFPQLAGF